MAYGLKASSCDPLSSDWLYVIKYLNSKIQVVMDTKNQIYVHFSTLSHNFEYKYTYLDWFHSLQSTLIFKGPQLIHNVNCIKRSLPSSHLITLKDFQKVNSRFPFVFASCKAICLFCCRWPSNNTCQPDLDHASIWPNYITYILCIP